MSKKKIKKIEPTSPYTVGPYKGYLGSIELDFESNVLHGSVIGTRDVITYEGVTPQALCAAFEESIEDYLTFCEEQGEDPEKPYSGKFNLRITPDLHRELSLEAAMKDCSLNAYIEEILLSRHHLATSEYFPRASGEKGGRT